jgi:Methyltransferase domain
LKVLQKSIRVESAWELFPDTFMCHLKVAESIRSFFEYSTDSTILDIGGIGRLKWFLDAKVTDANKESGTDGCFLPYDDNMFQFCVSINTLEHVFDKEQFICEALRVSRSGVILCFPFEGTMNCVEDLKNSIGHHHPLAGSLPNIENILKKIPHYQTHLSYGMPNWMHIAFIAGINRMTSEIKSFINHHLIDTGFWESDKKNGCTVILQIIHKR